METPNNVSEVKKKSPLRFIIFGIILIAGGIYGYKKIGYAMAHETTDNAQVETQLVPVLPRVAGYVKTIAVKDYDSVHTGQLLVELDNDELTAQLQQMNAELQSARADLANAQAALNNAIVSLSVNKGNIDIGQVKLDKTKKDYDRDQKLFAESAITQHQLDDSRFAYETALKQLDNNHNDLSSADSRISVLKTNIQREEAALKIKQAAIDQQQLKISYTKIYAPTSGKIGKKNISEGQFVQAGVNLFTIVNDTAYWVIANFKESQIEHLRPGMPADIEIDAYPNMKIRGELETLSDATGARFALLPPDNSSGNFVKVTQRIPVKIVIKDSNRYREQLRAGLSAFVTIPIE